MCFYHRRDFLSSFSFPLIIKAFPIHFQIKVRMVKDVVSPRSAGNLHDKASSPHPPIYECEGGREKVGAANVKGRSNVNDLYASQSEKNA